MLSGTILNRDFYIRDTLTVAKELIGCVLVVAESTNDVVKFINGDKFCSALGKFKCGKIVETEAYLGHNDKAAHSYNKKPGGRTDAMFGIGGHAYIYLIYGMYHCLNLVAQKAGVPEGVLIRALEPLDSTTSHRIYAGPGKLCREMKITREDYATNLCITRENPSRLFVIKPDNFILPTLKHARRINIDYSEEAANYLYRFYDENSKSVSVKEKQKKVINYQKPFKN